MTRGNYEVKLQKDYISRVCILFLHKKTTQNCVVDFLYYSAITLTCFLSLPTLSNFTTPATFAYSVSSNVYDLWVSSFTGLVSGRRAAVVKTPARSLFMSCKTMTILAAWQSNLRGVISGALRCNI